MVAVNIQNRFGAAMQGTRRRCWVAIAVVFVLAVAAGLGWVRGQRQNRLWEELHAEAKRLYRSGRFDRAEQTFDESLKMARDFFGTRDFRVVNSLYNLGMVKARLGKHQEAEVLYTRGLGLAEDVFGAEHEAVLHHLRGLVEIYYSEKRYDAAKPVCQKLLALEEQALGSNYVRGNTWHSEACLDMMRIKGSD